FLYQPDRGEGSPVAAVKRRSGNVLEQALYRQTGGPAWHCIVANIDEPRGLEAMAEKSDDRLSRRRADPAVDAMKRHEIELRQLAPESVGQVLKTGFQELDVFEPGRPGDACGMHHVNRVEIHRDEPCPRIAGGEDQAGQTLSASKLAIGEILADRGGF